MKKNDHFILWHLEEDNKPTGSYGYRLWETCRSVRDELLMLLSSDQKLRSLPLAFKMIISPLLVAPSDHPGGCKDEHGAHKSLENGARADSDGGVKM